MFDQEGEYNIVVESTDKTNTTAYSDIKDLNVSFVVDRTAPVLTISGLEENGRYQVDEQTVTIIPTDDGGKLYSLKVVVLDSSGNPIKDDTGKDISVRFDMSGDEFEKYLADNNGKVILTIPEGLGNQVEFICNDYTLNSEGKSNEYNKVYSNITISQSSWVIFYANKPLFYGSIAAVLIVISTIIFLIIFIAHRRKSKNK